jgi:hypothetical protein
MGMVPRKAEKGYDIMSFALDYFVVGLWPVGVTVIQPTVDGRAYTLYDIYLYPPIRKSKDDSRAKQWRERNQGNDCLSLKAYCTG